MATLVVISFLSGGYPAMFCLVVHGDRDWHFMFLPDNLNGNTRTFHAVMKEFLASRRGCDKAFDNLPVKKNNSIPASKGWRMVLLFFSLSVLGPGFERLAQAETQELEFPLVTNVSQLGFAAQGNQGAICAFSLAGTVLAGDPGSGRIFFQDDSGAEILETRLTGPSLLAGQRIQLRGTNYVVPTEIGVSLGKLPVVDNDGEHSETKNVGTVFLKTGRHLIQVLWFNHLWEGTLNVAYSGPGVSRRTIPNSVLFRPVLAADGTMQFTPGLNYRCFQGQWQKLPPFESLVPVKTGVTDNFDLKVRTSNEGVGLIFDGFIEVNQDGFYTFYLRSDDGSQLFIDDFPTQLTVTGSGSVPEPRRMEIGQPLPGESGAVAAEVEGNVTFLGRHSYGTELELASVDTHLRLVVCNVSGEPPRYLLGSRVRVRGICLNIANNEGHRMAKALVAPNWESVHVLTVAPEFWPACKLLKISDYSQRNGLETSGIVRLDGKLRWPSSAESWPELEDDTGSVPVELLNSFSNPPAGEVECLGRWSTSGSNGVLREAVWRELPKNLDQGTNALPLLTTAAQVQQLNRAEAQRGYRTKIRGVVTFVTKNRDCIVLQDSTRGVFVGLQPAWIWDPPRVGENLEIEGTCIAASFSPIVILNKARRLGMGALPAPMQPTWDQLIRGSLDSQYVEIRGMVTETHDNHLTLLMFGGKIDVEFSSSVGPLESFLHSVVRIRGCMFAKWDETTLLVTIDHPLCFQGATICVDVLPPLDPFDADLIRAREMMQFDVQGDIFRRVKIAGQVLHGGAGMYYLIDHGFGLRFQPVHPVTFEPGDNVEVVGLVELGGGSPILREAVARKTGHSPLPAPWPLVFDNVHITPDATRVWVEGLLLDSQKSGSTQVLEMQVGLKSFVARLDTKDRPAGPWAVGSRLKLTGIYSDSGAHSSGAPGVNSFELLLNSPDDVEVIARPSWWTLNRLLAMVAVLAAGLALAFMWISQLRRQVERRTLQLKREINERQRAEQDRAIEQERSRIARDLHDDLGSRLTAINMLAMHGHKPLPPEVSKERLQLIADRSRSMVTALDALVWAVNPQNDTVAALAEYLASYTEELLTRMGIVCRVELPLDFPDRIIVAESRHNVLLAVKEAITNAVRHGRPSEVLLHLALSGNELKIIIHDNGCGFDLARHVPGNGLENLHERMKKAGGCCQIQSSPGNGATVTLILPV
jgi:signal transduction histidine kinase